MRTEIELIQLLLNSEELFNFKRYGGLCSLIWGLEMYGFITQKEEEILDEIIIKNKPIIILNNLFYFQPYQWQPRKKYLQQLLIKYSK